MRLLTASPLVPTPIRAILTNDEQSSDQYHRLAPGVRNRYFILKHGSGAPDTKLLFDYNHHETIKGRWNRTLEFDRKGRFLASASRFANHDLGGSHWYEDTEIKLSRLALQRMMQRLRRRVRVRVTFRNVAVDLVGRDLASVCVSFL